MICALLLKYDMGKGNEPDVVLTEVFRTPVGSCCFLRFRGPDRSRRPGISTGMVAGPEKFLIGFVFVPAKYVEHVPSSLH